MCSADGAAVRWGQEAFIGVSPSARTPHGWAGSRALLGGDRLCLAARQGPRLAMANGLDDDPTVPTHHPSSSPFPILPARFQAYLVGRRNWTQLRTRNRAKTVRVPARTAAAAVRPVQAGRSTAATNRRSRARVGTPGG